MKFLQVKIFDEAFKKKLKQHCLDRDITISNFIRQVLHIIIDEDKEEPPQPEATTIASLKPTSCCKPEQL